MTIFSPPIKALILLCMTLLISACDQTKNRYGVEYTPESISKTKLCADVNYYCLTETQDATWRKKLLATTFSFPENDLLFIRLRSIEKTLTARKALGKKLPRVGNNFHQLRSGVFDFRDTLRSTPDKGVHQAHLEALKRAAAILGITEQEFLMDRTYQLSEREEKAIKQRRKEKDYDEIAQMLDLFYPGFWKDAPQEERIQWVMQVEKKAVRYNPTGAGRGPTQIMANICAMIGLDFETKPEMAPIVKYLSTIKNGNHGQMSQTMDYLHFTYLGWDYKLSGNYITGWSLSSALGSLPYPKRRVPRLSEDMPGGAMYQKAHDKWRVYKDTIWTGVK